MYIAKTTAGLDFPKGKRISNNEKGEIPSEVFRLRSVPGDSSGSADSG